MDSPLSAALPDMGIAGMLKRSSARRRESEERNDPSISQKILFQDR
jgi:hypothetical protein